MKKFNWSRAAYLISEKNCPRWAKKSMQQRIVINGLLKKYKITENVRNFLQGCFDRLMSKRGIYLTPKQEKELIQILSPFLNKQNRKMRWVEQQKRQARKKAKEQKIQQHTPLTQS